MSNLVSILRKRANRYTDIAYRFLEDNHQASTLTYSELDRKARAIAQFLQEKTLENERLLLIYPPGIDFITSFLGCLYAGVIPVPVFCPDLSDNQKHAESLTNIAQNAQIIGILTNEVSQTIVQKIFLNQENLLIKCTDQIDVERAVLYRPIKITTQKIAYLQYSSGSTAVAKAVIITHGQLTQSLKSNIRAWHYNKNSVTLTWAPHHHVFGLVCGILVPLYHGTHSIVMPTSLFLRKPLDWLQAIEKYKVTHSGCPNFGYNLCIEEISENDIRKLNLKTWKVAINGGEKVQLETLLKFSNKFSRCQFQLKNFCSAYGSSELAGTIAVTEYGKKPVFLALNRDALQKDIIQIESNDDHSVIFTSSGRFIKGVQGIIVNPQSLKPARKGEVGELWLTGKLVATGYWNQQSETQKTFNVKLRGINKKFFRTGDLGFIHHKELFLTGRIKDVIVLHGKKHFPIDIEISTDVALASLPVGNKHVAFSTVVEGQEEVVFLQEVKNNIDEETHSQINETIASAIQKEHGIHIYDILLVKENSLPKTASGKLQRQLCKKNYLEKKLDEIYNTLSQLKQSENSTPSHNAENTFKQLVARVLKINEDEVHLKNPLSYFKLDSIRIVQLTNAINDSYQLDITPNTIFEYVNLEAFFNEQIVKQPEKTLITLHNETKKIRETDIAVIGMSGIFPGAKNLEEFWKNLCDGIDAITKIPLERWDWKEYYGNPKEDKDKTNVTYGGFIEGMKHFDAQFFNISPREAELIDPQQRLFLQTVWKTIEHAGYSTETLAKLRTGLFVGVFNHDYAELLQQKGIHDAYITTGTTHSILANRISYLLNLSGPSEAIDTACSSSLVALHHAIHAIYDGDCDVAIAGGVNALLSPTPFLVASQAGMLSEDGRCKTFDKSANGYVRAEGVGAVLLKPLHQALAAGDTIYGVIKGTAINHGGHVSSLTVPNPHAQADVIMQAALHAHVSLETLSYIETHGTGTALGDPVEINGLTKAFNELTSKEKKYYCGLGSVKTHVGHLEAAAGITGLIKVLLAMQHRKIPGNLHFKELNPYIKLNNTPFYLVTETKEWKPFFNHLNERMPLRAGISSFGFGGTNAHVIVEEAPKLSRPELHLQHHPYLITLSAKTDAALRQKVQDLLNFLQQDENAPSLSAISFTLNEGRNHFLHRYAVCVYSIDELKNALVFALKNNFTTLKNTEGTDEYHQQLLLICADYLQGKELDHFKIKYASQNRIALPTYPFAETIHWLPELDKTCERLPEALKDQEDQSDLIIRVQADCIKEVSRLLKLNPSLITIESPLTDLGFDSITFKEFSNQLESLYKIELNPSVFFSYPSIIALSQYLLQEHKDKLALHYNLHVTNKVQDKPLNPKKISRSTKQNASQKIAIIGMNAYFPQSKNLTEFWHHLKAQHDLVMEIPSSRFNWQDFYSDNKLEPTKSVSKWAACISDADQFDAAFFNISAREAALMDPQQRLLMEVVWKAIEDAGYDPLSFSGKNIGFFAGIEFNDYQVLMQKSLKNLSGHLATGTSHAMIANRISYFLNLLGPSEVIDTACSSSLVAIHHAIHSIRQGECETAIAGGVSLMFNPETLIITSQLGALSSDGRCKTFDKSANGYVKGEGVVALVLKDAEKALEDQDHIYGYIIASAVNHSGKAQSLTAPNAISQSHLLVNAYSQANIDPQTVSYIETHGTGTELGDPIEIEGLKLGFNQLVPAEKRNPNFACGLGSLKTNIGHLEPASGIASVVKVLLAMKYKTLPGIVHFKELNPFIKLEDSPFYIVEKTSLWQRLKNNKGEELPLRAGVSSFGFGGTCAHVVLEENLEFNTAVAQGNLYYPIVLSAKTHESLNQKIVELLEWVELHAQNESLLDLSFTLAQGRSHFNERYATVVDSFDSLKTTLNAYLNENNLTMSLLGDSKESYKQFSPLFEEIYQTTLASLSQNELTPTVYLHKLQLLADLYVKHFNVDWNIIFQNRPHKRLAGLPTYPFVKKPYWFDQEEDKQHEVMKNERSQFVDVHSFIRDYLRAIFAEKLRLKAESISLEETYEIYGVDSLLGLEITNRITDDFQGLPKTILYEKNKLTLLGDYLEKKYPNIVKQLYEKQTGSSVAITKEVEKNVVPSTFTQAVQDEPIAIIGMSGIFPQAKNIDEFWENLISGKDCITTVPKDRWNYEDYPIMVGGEKKYFKYGGFIEDIDKFDPLFFGISPKEAMVLDPQERIFLENAWTTLEDAGYTKEKLWTMTQHEVGVFVGVTYNFYPLWIHEEWARGNQLPLDIQMFSIANRLSYFLNLKGPSFIVDTACSSSLAAIHLAYESILRGECKMAIAGGVNLSLHPAKYHFLGGYNFLSDEGRCASFAEGGTGYVPSEGVGSVLLKRLSDAIKDNDKIYGVIKASSMNHGGKTSGYTVPNPNAQAELILNAIKKGQINPRKISYIEAHGTGTALGDPIEIRGLQEAFEEYTDEKQFCAIGSVKSNIGHLESAAGVSQLIKVLLQMKYQQLAPSIHAEKLNPFIDFQNTPFYVQKHLTEWKAENTRCAGVSSFGAGGTNVHLIVEEYISHEANISTPKIPFIFLLSAQNEERLGAYVQEYLAFFEKNHEQYSKDKHFLHQLCYTLQTGRESMSMRLAILGKDYEDIVNKLKTFKDKNQKNVWLNDVGTHAAPKEIINLNEPKFEEIIEAWIKGVTLPWQTFYEGYPLKPLSLPSYPFAKRRCWVSEPKVAETIPHPVTQTVPLHDWLYETVWEKGMRHPKSSTLKKGKWIIFSDNELGFILQERLGKESILCFLSDKDEVFNENTFYLQPLQSKIYPEVINKIKEEKVLGFIYLWPLLNESQNENAGKYLLEILQHLQHNKLNNKVLFGLITRGAQAIPSKSPVNIWQHSLGSLVRIFGAENAHFDVLTIDLALQKSLQQEADFILQELEHFTPSDNLVAFRDNERYTIKLKSYLLSQAERNEKPRVVLITGGLGALGCELIKWLVKEGATHFLLFGKTELPEKSKWSTCVDETLKEKIKILQLFEAQNIQYRYETIDISQIDLLTNIVTNTEKEWNKNFDGVFHLAGVTTDHLSIEKITPDDFNEVMCAKVHGGFALHTVFKYPTLKCFVLFSSIAALPFFGMSGLSLYAMANEFLNGLALLRQSQGLQGISIDWAAWSEKGMSHRYNHNAFLTAVGMSAISLEHGMNILSNLLTQSTNPIVFKIEWQKFLSVNPHAKKLTFFSHFIKENINAVKATGGETLEYSIAEIKERILATLCKLLVLEKNEIQVTKPFSDYGLDSISGINFVSDLNSVYQDKISPMDLYKYPTVEQLTQFVHQSLVNQDESERLVKNKRDFNSSEIEALLEKELNEIDHLL